MDLHSSWTSESNHTIITNRPRPNSGALCKGHIGKHYQLSTHVIHNEDNQAYFCTFTCHKWLPLFEIANAYQEVYNWFEYLKKDDCKLLGYVIMPNHVHCILFPTSSKKILNSIVGEGKRFIAYGDIKRLEQRRKSGILNLLRQDVHVMDRKKGKKHQVFRISFDAKLCFSERMLEQKLDYIHRNPVSGKWRLVSDYIDYEHSSAAYYELNNKVTADVTHYKAIF